jgi:hypothetical protein
MKKIIVLTLMALSFGATELQAQTSGSCCNKKSTDVSVSGYYKSNGSYVQPHYRSGSNKTKSDNFSTKGNKNPYTGRKGSKSTSTNRWLSY